ncbi:MAG: type II toxin-antitoxin system VapC family toxin [bacterium]
MKFWDTSALVPLCAREAASEQMLNLLQADRSVAVWWASMVECSAAFARRGREGRLTPDDWDYAATKLTVLKDSSFEVEPSERVRTLATRLVRVHTIRASDALQLAAALVWIDKAAPGEFVTLDRRLHTAARLEGFRALP